MKKSFIGGMALGAFLVSLIPHSVRTDEETGGLSFAVYCGHGERPRRKRERERAAIPLPFLRPDWTMKRQKIKWNTDHYIARN